VVRPEKAFADSTLPRGKCLLCHAPQAAPGTLPRRGTRVAIGPRTMNISPLRFAPVVSLLLAAAACSSGPGAEAVGSSSAAVDGSTIVSRGMEWVNADLHYCQAAHDDVDGDSSCWAWEGSSHRCDRESNSAWNAYRSDCSGFVTWAWGLPPVGDGGYVTSEFAPYDSSFSHTISGSSLQPGDALNKTPDEHIILFKQWVSVGHSAVFMEEPGCSASEPYAHEFTSNVSISGSEVYVDYEGATFYAIRYNGTTAGGGGGGSSSSGGGGGSPVAPDACDKGGGYCTETLQCDGDHWIVRQDDAAACTTIENVQEPCSVGGGYCTETLQCDGGHWVPRQDDPSACTSGPGAD
jgi:uncharacterized membrane protein YgcG